MFEGQLLAATNFLHITIFTIIAILYLAVCWPSATLIEHLERRMKSLPGEPAAFGRWWPGWAFRSREARA
jgi:hypothetical protein